MTRTTKVYLLALLLGLPCCWIISSNSQPTVLGQSSIYSSEAGPFEATASVTGTDVVVYQRTIRGTLTLANVEIENAGANALTDFKVQLKDHEFGEWYTYLGSTDWSTTTISNLRFVSTVVPNTLSASGTSHIHFRVNAAMGMRLVATCAAGTTVEARGSWSAE
jgi:hypothetical protein